MLSHPLLFELATEWRTWKGQWFKYLILLFGFSLLAVLLAMGLRIGELLFIDPPAWVNSDKHKNLYTLSRYHQKVGMHGVSLNTIEGLKGIPGIESIAYIAFRSRSIKHQGTLFDSTEIAYFSESFRNQISLKFPTKEGVAESQLAWVSTRFFEQELKGNPAVIGSTIRITRNPVPLIIAGVLPPELNRLGKNQPDIWVNDKNLRYHTPFVAPPVGSNNPEKEKILNKFLRNAPIYYVIFALEKAIDPAEIQQIVAANFTVDSAMTFSMPGSELRVQQGVVFDPETKQALKNQWLALLALILALSIILTINALTLFGGHIVMHWRSIKTKRILGASQKSFLLSDLWSLALPLIFLTLFSYVLLLLGEKTINFSELYKSFAGNTRFSVSAPIWAASLLLTFVVLYLSKAMQVLNFSEEKLFDRAFGNSKTRSQLLLADLFLVIQLAGGFLIASIAASMALSEWQSQSAVSIDRSVTEVKISYNGDAKIPNSLYSGRFPGLSSIPVGASIPGFQEPLTASIKRAGTKTSVSVNAIYVSENYFDLLAVNKVTWSGSWPNGVIVSRSLASVLAEKEDYSDLEAAPVAVKMLFEKTYPIVGVIDDIPHFGVSQRGDPMVYLPISAAFLNNNMALISKPEHAEALADAANLWAQKNLLNPRISPIESLDEIIRQTDSLRLGFLAATLAVSLLINILIFISISYQIKSRIKMTEHEYGVRMVYGCSASHLILVACRDCFLALLVAVPIATAGLWWLDSRYAQFLDVPLLRVSVLPPVVLITALLILLAATVPIASLLKKSLFGLMRHT